jgi:Protein of unknown function (DUF3553)
MTPISKILTVLAEGGGMDIFGIQRGGRWFFKMVSNDHTPTLLDEDPIYRDSGWVNSLSEALSQVGWPWNAMTPKMVHPNFGAEIFGIKIAQDKICRPGERNKSQWVRLCGVENTLAANESLGIAPEVESLNSQNAKIQGKKIDFRKGQHVKHSNKPEWGIGQIMEDSTSLAVRVMFASGGEREFALPLTALVTITGGT